MENEMYSRTIRLIGQAGFDRLRRAHVCLFGVGGVGGACAEALVRAGIGKLTLVDPDTVAVSNLNRQLVATQETLGLPKTEAAAIRLHSIDPDCTILERRTFYLPENAADFDFAQYDYVLDAIDTVSAKLSIIEECKKVGNKQPPASISFVPPVCGYLLAGEVVRDLLRETETENEGSDRL